MIDIQTVSDFVYENLTLVTDSKRGTHFNARCPLCGDSTKFRNKKRFHLDYSNGKPIYHCFNCGEKGNFIKLYSFIKGIEYNEALKELYSFNPDETKSRIKKKKRKVVKKEKNTLNYVLEDCVGINSKTDGIIAKEYQKKLTEYLKERYLPKSMRIMAAYKGEYKGRYIIIVDDEKGNIIYFQGRRMFPEMEPKYKNPSVEKDGIIFNKHRFDNKKHVVVTEGLIDAMSIGEQGTSCLGKEVSDSFLDELFFLTNKGVILALDNDEAGKKSVENIIKNNENSSRLRYFVYPKEYSECKDINNIRVRGIEDIYSFIVNNSYKLYSVKEMMRR